jgi:uncharacterized tellurite resistance protein B-like protein
MARKRNSDSSVEKHAATREHEAHEARIQALRDLLRHAPRPIRSRKDHEPELSSAPFPPPERLIEDQRRLEVEVADRLARVRPPLLLVWRAVLALSLTGAVACLVLAWTRPLPGAVGATACVALAWAVRGRIRRSQRQRLRSEEHRIREDVFSSIQAELDRDRALHEGREAERTSRKTALLAGEASACADAFHAAVAGLPLPAGSKARLEMRTPRHAYVHVDLYARSVIPTRRSTLLKSGRVSYRNRPKKEVREDDARGIANLGILLAAAGFDALPSVEEILLSAFRLGVDPATGRDARPCLSSALFDRAGFSRLKFDRLDPIAAVRGFPSRFSCSASFILKPVEPWSSTGWPGDEGAPTAEIAPDTGRDQSKEIIQRAEDVQDAPRLSALELAQHALALAMACARADGTISPAELESVSRMIEEQFSLGTTEVKRLTLRRASLAESEISIERPANELKDHLSPRERQLLMEKIFSVSVSDGRVGRGELDLFLSIGNALDLAPAFLDDLQRRWAPHGDPQDSATVDRGRWLSALELPQDAAIDRAAIERALRRQEDLYSEEKFRLLASELREMAARRLELARRAAAALLTGLPELSPEVGPSSLAEPLVRRENPDLDDIFGIPPDGGT